MTEDGESEREKTTYEIFDTFVPYTLPINTVDTIQSSSWFLYLASVRISIGTNTKKKYFHLNIRILNPKMDDFESVYLQDEFNSGGRRLCALDRLKIGEIFQVRQNQFVFSCIHCTQEFQQFARFSDHVQSHYHSALQWLAPQMNETHTHTTGTSTEMAPAPGMHMENVEWLFSDSSNESTHGEENRQEVDENIQMPQNIECKVSIREGDENESQHENSMDTDEPVSLESRFKLKHPLIRVKDTEDARKLLPYFSKKFPFIRTEDQRFRCPLCEYYAISKANLREHM